MKFEIKADPNNQRCFVSGEYPHRGLHRGFRRVHEPRAGRGRGAEHQEAGAEKAGKDHAQGGQHHRHPEGSGGREPGLTTGCRGNPHRVHSPPRTRFVYKNYVSDFVRRKFVLFLRLPFVLFLLRISRF